MPAYRPSGRPHEVRDSRGKGVIRGGTLENAGSQRPLLSMGLRKKSIFIGFSPAATQNVERERGHPDWSMDRHQGGPYFSI